MTATPAPVRQRSYAELESRLAAATPSPLQRRKIGQQAGTYAIWEVRIPARRRIPRSRRRVRVLLNGGTHGDEPAGVEALLQFLEQRRYEAWLEIAFTLIPCLNPWGFVRGIREGPAGHDLNRAFRRASPATPEVSAIKRVLSRRQLTCSMDCHEDCDAEGFYAYELPEVSSLGQAVVEAVGAVGPISPDCLVEEIVPVRDGLARTDDLRPQAGDEMAAMPPEAWRDFRTFVRAWPTWPLPIYLWHRHGARAFTFETPTKLPLDQRVGMQLAAIEAVLQALAAEAGECLLVAGGECPDVVVEEDET